MVIVTMQCEGQKCLEEAGDKRSGNSSEEQSVHPYVEFGNIVGKDQMANQEKPVRRESAVFPVHSVR